MYLEDSLFLFGIILQEQCLEIGIVLGIKEGANSKQASGIGESGEGDLPLYPRKLNADEHGHRMLLLFLLVYHINLLSPALPQHKAPGPQKYTLTSNKPPSGKQTQLSYKCGL
jgi:hypothetical protein